MTTLLTMPVNFLINIVWGYYKNVEQTQCHYLPFSIAVTTTAASVE